MYLMFLPILIKIGEEVRERKRELVEDSQRRIPRNEG